MTPSIVSTSSTTPSSKNNKTWWCQILWAYTSSFLTIPTHFILNYCSKIIHEVLHDCNYKLIVKPCSYFMSIKQPKFISSRKVSVFSMSTPRCFRTFHFVVIETLMNRVEVFLVKPRPKHRVALIFNVQEVSRGCFVSTAIQLWSSHRLTAILPVVSFFRQWASFVPFQGAQDASLLYFMTVRRTHC